MTRAGVRLDAATGVAEVAAEADCVDGTAAASAEVATLVLVESSAPHLDLRCRLVMSLPSISDGRFAANHEYESNKIDQNRPEEGSSADICHVHALEGKCTHPIVFWSIMI